MIKHPLDLSELRSKWIYVALGSDSVADWRTTWDAFEREVLAVGQPRRPREME